MIGTVKGDLHDIGKNLVGMMMEGAGFEVIDLGIDTSAEQFVEAVERKQPELVGLSALLTTTMVQMKNVLEALQGAGLRDSVKVIVGGAPVTEQYAQEIGADAYASNASVAVETAKALLGRD
jgi:5-methyltetrahydrofolate--homocysteine methyltransferase